MDTGFIAISAKPVHAGHMGLIDIASRENDLVKVFVSLKTRARPGEIPIFQEDMTKIWNLYLIPVMPKNVEIEFVNVPVSAVFEDIIAASESMSKDVYRIYSDPEDLASRFSPENFKKYAPNVKIIPRPIKRTETVNVSGTKMRAAIASGDFNAFVSGMPKNIDVKAIWKILSRHANEVTPEKKTSRRKHVEGTIVDYVKLMIEKTR